MKTQIKNSITYLGLTFLILIFVAGCATNSPPPKDFDFGEYPSDYQNIVTNYVQQNLNVYGDVYYKNWISPYKGSIIDGAFYHHQYGWTVQVLMSCKIREFGGYGNYEFSFILKDEKVLGQSCYAPDMVTFSYPTVKKSETK